MPSVEDHVPAEIHQFDPPPEMKATFEKLQAEAIELNAPGMGQPIVAGVDAEVPQTPQEARDDRLHMVTGYGLRGLYGPFSVERAGEVADELNVGNWRGEYWVPIPIDLLPGQPKPAQRKDMTEEVKPLYAWLDRREGDQIADDQVLTVKEND